MNDIAEMRASLAQQFTVFKRKHTWILCGLYTVRNGGSSITQQLVKNVLIPPEERVQRSYTRKIKEAIMAIEVTRRYSKDQILEWYLNYNFYGNAAIGVEAAARIYFDKSASEVTLAEAAMLRRQAKPPLRWSSSLRCAAISCVIPRPFFHGIVRYALGDRICMPGKIRRGAAEIQRQGEAVRR